VAIVVNVYGKANMAQIEKAEKTLRGMKDEVGKQPGPWGRFGGAVSSTGAKIAAGLAAAGIVTFASQSITAASDLDEAINRTKVVFGENAQAMLDWGADAAEGMGMSNLAALDASSNLGNMFTSMGIGNDEAVEMSTNMVELGSDLASFNNIDPAVALEKLRAGLVGETEPLRELGVNLSAAGIEAEAFEKGIAAQGQPLTDAQKAQAAYSLILGDTSKAHGDFERTSGGVANSTRILKAKVADLSAKLGRALLPAVGWVVNAVSKVLSLFLRLPRPIQGIIGGIGGIAVAALLMAPFVGNAIRAVKAVKALGLAQKATALATRAAAIAQGLLNVATLAYAAAIGIVLIAAAAAIAGIVWAYGEWQKAEKDLAEARANGAANEQTNLERAKAAYGENSVQYQRHVQIIKDANQQMADDQAAQLTGWRSWIAGWFEYVGSNGVWGYVVRMIREGLAEIQALWEGLTSTARAAWDAVSAVITGVWDALWSAVGPAWGAISDAITAVWDALGTAATTAWGAVKTTITGVWDALSLAATTAWDAIKGAITAVWDALSSAVGTVWDGIKTAITSVWDALSLAATTAWGAIKDTITGVWNALASVVGEVWGGIKTAITKVWNALDRAATTVWGAIKRAILAVWNALDRAVGRIWDKGIKKAILAAWNALDRATDRIWDKGIKKTVLSAWEQIKGTLAEAESIIRPVTDAWTKVKDVTKAVWDGIQLELDQTIGWAVDKIDWLWGKLTTLATKLKDFLGMDTGGDAGGSGTGGGAGGRGGVPALGASGYVDSPMLALIGEKEPEYVIPESQMGRFSSAASGGRGAGGMTVVEKRFTAELHWSTVTGAPSDSEKARFAAWLKPELERLWEFDARGALA
jgi:phage-related protein